MTAGDRHTETREQRIERIRKQNDPSPFILRSTKQLAEDDGTVILTYEGKHGESRWNISTPEKESKALQALFKLLDEWGCYGELKEPDFTQFGGCVHSCEHHEAVPVPEGEKKRLEVQVALYQKAKEGDMKALAQLLERRKNYEYEGWDIDGVE